MNLRLIPAAALLLVCAIPAPAEERTWNLKLKGVEKAGQKYAIDNNETQTMVMKILMGEETVQDQKSSESMRFEGTAEVLEAVDGKSGKLRVTFRKALRATKRGADDGESAYGFEGKAVIATRSGKTWNYAYEDGGEVAEDDVAGLQKALNHSKSEDKKPFEEVFAPGKPVAIGGSWSPAIEDVIAGFGDDDKVAFDAEQSTATFTLISVTVRDGVEFARIEGRLSLAANSFGPLALDEPIQFDVTFGLETSADGSLPDGIMEASMVVKGKRTATLQDGQELGLDIDMTLKGRASRTSVR